MVTILWFEDLMLVSGLSRDSFESKLKENYPWTSDTDAEWSRAIDAWTGFERTGDHSLLGSLNVVNQPGVWLQIGGQG